MANISFAIFMLLVVAAMAVFFTWAAWVFWHHPERAPRMRLTKSSDPSVIRGHERGVVPFAGFVVGITVMMGDVSVGHSWTGTPLEVVKVIGIIALTTSMLSICCQAAVAWFNRPKFLVPHRLRDEAGSVTEWWRWRRDLRIALKEAAERDALGHHSDPR